jgi:hypothetical protein
MKARLASLLAVLCLVDAGLGAGRAVSQEQRDPDAGPRLLLRIAADSGLVGHFKWTGRENYRLVFDLPADDPRVELLASASAPRENTIEIAGTLVSAPSVSPDERRHYIYWLGFRVAGDEQRGLTPLQWDSIFNKVGRQAVLRFTSRGQPLGVDVGSEAVRPVGNALARVMSTLALALPADSAAEGSSWEDMVAVPVAAPDGSRKLAVIRVTYRLTRYDWEADGLKAHIAFDGRPERVEGVEAEISGTYGGESVFSVGKGRYDQMLSVARLEVKWADSGGLPPSRTVVEWTSELIRR